MISQERAGKLSIHNPPGNGLRPSTTWSGAVSFCALPPFSNLRVATLPMSFFDEIAAGPGRCPLWDGHRVPPMDRPPSLLVINPGQKYLGPKNPEAGSEFV
jgi:hypothetical protein